MTLKTIPAYAIVAWTITTPVWVVVVRYLKFWNGILPKLPGKGKYWLMLKKGK